MDQAELDHMYEVFIKNTMRYEHDRIGSRVETVQSSPQSPKPSTGTGTAVPPKLWALILLQSPVLFSPYVFLFYLISFLSDGCYASCFLLPLLSFLLDIFFE